MTYPKHLHKHMVRMLSTQIRLLSSIPVLQDSSQWIWRKKKLGQSMLVVTHFCRPKPFLDLFGAICKKIKSPYQTSLCHWLLDCIPSLTDEYTRDFFMIDGWRKKPCGQKPTASSECSSISLNPLQHVTDHCSYGRCFPWQKGAMSLWYLYMKMGFSARNVHTFE